MPKNKALGAVVDRVLGKCYAIRCDSASSFKHAAEWVEVISVTPTPKGPMEVVLHIAGDDYAEIEALKLPLNVLLDAINYGLLREIAEVPKV